MTGVLDAREDRRAAKKQRQQQGRNSLPQSEFINRELSQEETAEYRVWREDYQTVFDLWAEMLEEGYRVNTKWDDYSNAHAAFVIPDERSDNSGYILTGRGGNPYRAISEALFKHAHVFAGAWVPVSRGRTSSEDPDF